MATCAWAFAVSCQPLLAGGFAGGATQRSGGVWRVLPGEFERQEAILLGWDADNVLVQRALVRIIEATWDKVQVLVIVRKTEDRATVASALRIVALPPDAVRVLHVPFDTIWARDYGPAVVRTRDGQVQIVDADYERGQRPRDNQVPTALAPQLRLPSVHTPLAIEGGNLLSNGAGLVVTTEKLLEQNAGRGYTENDVAGLLRETYGAEQVVLLEPLFGEPTGHVDMFCTFTGADTVLVAELPEEIDPVNADLLDRNAARLARVRTPYGPLRVFRIPMPPRDGHVWRTYTNVLYANGVVLVPTYPGTDPDWELQALEIYRRLLPGRSVVGIDCTHLIPLGGAVHCVSMNLARIGDLPSELERSREDAAIGVRPSHPDDGWQPADGSDGAGDEWTPASSPRRAPEPRTPMFAADSENPFLPRPLAFVRD